MRSRVRARRSDRSEPGRCPYCHDVFAERDPAWVCPVCSTRQHAECARDNKGCSVLGCAGRGKDALARGMDPAARARNRSFALGIVAILAPFLLIGGALAWPFVAPRKSLRPGAEAVAAPETPRPSGPLAGLGRWERPAPASSARKGSRVVAVVSEYGTPRAFAIGGAQGLESFRASSSDAPATTAPLFDHPEQQVALSPDGRRGVAWREGERGALAFELSSGVPTGARGFSPDRVHRAAFGPWSADVVLLGPKGELKAWDLSTGRVRWQARTAIAGGEVAVSPSGRRALLGGGSSLELWDLEDGRRVGVLAVEGDVQQVAWSPDGARALATTSEGRLLELDARIELSLLKGTTVTGPARALAWGPGPREAAVFFGSSFEVVDLDRGGSRAPGRLEEALSLAFSPDGRYAVEKTASGARFRCWDLTNFASIQVDEPAPPPEVARTPRRAVVDVAFSTDGAYAVTAGASGKVELWFLAEGATSRGTYERLPELLDVRKVAVSPEGRWILATDDEEAVWLLDRRTGAWERADQPGAPVRFLGFGGKATPKTADLIVSPTGRTVAVARGPALERRPGLVATFPLGDGRRILQVLDDAVLIRGLGGTVESRVAFEGRATCAALSPDQHVLWVGTSLGLERFRVP